MISIGGQPLLWHVMKYYAHFGHRDFILCLGHGGEAIRSHFQTRGTPALGPDWRITFVETGASASVGERLKAVEPYLAGEERFLANYADGLSDHALPLQLEFAQRAGTIACLLSVRPNLSCHAVTEEPGGTVTAVRDVADSNLRINGGFFVFRREIFRVLGPGEDLVHEPFRRLVAARQLTAFRSDGFWMAVDTAKDKARADELAASGIPPWAVWQLPRHERVG
jgi:glucose-1-phosphate cytidylyltransferase